MEPGPKLERLKRIIRSLNSILVGFSGGIDSTFLLRVAVDVLGKDKVLAVTVKSEVITEPELKAAGELAESIGAAHLVLPFPELENELFASNPPNRCYHCKQQRYKALIQLAREQYLESVLDGSNFSDLNDYRPGSRALKELGIRRPLQEAMLTKDEIRELSRQLGLPSWNQPARACLASRFPYGVRITASALHQVARAEAVLQAKGFTQCRVRHHGSVARIEVPQADFTRVMTEGLLEAITSGIKATGYSYVTLDLEGYRTGSLNELLNGRNP